MVGCYTDATNPRVRGGFIALKKEREHIAGTYGRNKEREHMAGKIWREHMVRKYGGNNAPDNLYQL
jgi:hypothetical protein